MLKSLGIAGIVLLAQSMNVRDIAEASGTIGLIIVLLSLFMVAQIIEQLMTLRMKTQVPTDLAATLAKLLEEKRYGEAQEQCRESESLLAQIVSAGLDEIALGFASVEKAMEDACQEQAARLLRKIEYLSVIGTIAPMLGLLGTVWGMILAFMEFEAKANPQVSELAPGIYKALVTTLEGLSVAIPALAAYAYFRNRVDELLARAARTAEHLLGDTRRRQILERRGARHAGGESPGISPAAHVEPKPRNPAAGLERDKS
ncbi:MAG: MotA/TolQ/ExbB proton channel family protein [Planctomycetaceae bacterium]